MKADSEVARLDLLVAMFLIGRSELLEKCTALEASATQRQRASARLERKAEDSQRALQAKGEEVQ